MKICNTTLDGDNCLWQAKNVYCKNCNITGDRIGWHSDNIIFEDCHINSTQPLCYCKKLRMVNCTMTNANLAFEFSDVEADIHSHFWPSFTAPAGQYSTHRPQATQFFGSTSAT